MKSALLVLLYGVAACLAVEAPHVVNVGNSGSFFDPAVVAALEGDIVSFVFSGIAHTVTQSSFDNPCSPLEGGFNSGISGTGTVPTNNPLNPNITVWNLQVTNASAPIWFYCQLSMPESHCEAGMVGVINAPSNDDFATFQARAKAITSTPKPTPTLTLSGIGAFATGPPSPTSLSQALTAPSSSSSTGGAASPTVASPSPSPTNSGGQLPIGAIVGGAVGGGLGLAIIAFLVFVVLIRQKRDRPAVAEQARVSFDVEPKDSTAVIGTVPIRPLPMGGLDSDRSTTLPLSKHGKHSIEAMRLANARSNMLRVNGPISVSSDDEPDSGSHLISSFDASQSMQGLYNDSQHSRDGMIPQWREKQPQMSPQHTDQRVDVHEIAREVAAILQPRVASPANSSVPSEDPGPSAPMPMPMPVPVPIHPQVPVARPRPVRQLPDPRHQQSQQQLQIQQQQPILPPTSPGPPKYSS